MNTPLSEQSSDSNTSFKEELEKLFKDYRLHHKDIDVCFRDAVATTHLITSIINLVDKEHEQLLNKILSEYDRLYKAQATDLVKERKTPYTIFHKIIEEQRAIIRSNAGE